MNTDYQFTMTDVANDVSFLRILDGNMKVIEDCWIESIENRKDPDFDFMLYLTVSCREIEELQMKAEQELEEQLLAL